ncbi:hypothetical protein [Nitriliruptor alkaliphilus]|uniref:hypothetical protein n=1 Tax=Nitriliruptor alkaliphilus TaxID=427918 RepID=UPI000695AB9E|nr:hypothetical protein [Nitriliruptor alkaliphilus]
MDNDEARALIEARLQQLRQLSYGQLRELDKERREVVAESGTTYQIVSYVLHDDKKHGHLRVSVAADDSGWRAYFPLVSDFIIAPDGSFIGE